MLPLHTEDRTLQFSYNTTGVTSIYQYENRLPIGILEIPSSEGCILTFILIDAFPFDFPRSTEILDLILKINQLTRSLFLGEFKVAFTCVILKQKSF